MQVLLYMQQSKMLHLEHHFYIANNITSQLPITDFQYQIFIWSESSTEMVYSNLQNNHGNPFHPCALSCGCVQLKRKESFHKSFYMWLQGKHIINVFAVANMHTICINRRTQQWIPFSRTSILCVGRATCTINTFHAGVEPYFSTNLGHSNFHNHLQCTSLAGQLVNGQFTLHRSIWHMCPCISLVVYFTRHSSSSNTFRRRWICHKKMCHE
jgi:hypothetical protein